MGDYFPIFFDYIESFVKNVFEFVCIVFKAEGFIVGWSSRNTVTILVIRNSKIEKLSLIKSQLKQLERI